MKITSYAKINLCLLVYKPNKTGVHPITSIFQTVSLADTLTIQTTQKKGLSLRYTGQTKQLPDPKDNLLQRLYDALSPYLKIGFDITLDKQIPIGGGLGGGSSNVAAVLGACIQEKWIKLSDNHCQRIARNLGSDIPYFLTGGTALVKGVGDRIMPLDPGKHRHFVLVNPGLFSDTGKAYNAFDQHPDLGIAARKAPSWVLNEHLGTNDLQAPVFSLLPELADVYQQIKQLGFDKVQMTGSGATLFIPLDSAEAALSAESQLSLLFPDFFVKSVEAVDRGFSVEDVT